jgi:hypothetical protein
MRMKIRFGQDAFQILLPDFAENSVNGRVLDGH